MRDWLWGVLLFCELPYNFGSFLVLFFFFVLFLLGNSHVLKCLSDAVAETLRLLSCGEA